MITAITAAIKTAIVAAKSSAIYPLLKYIRNVIAQGTIWAAFTGLTDVFRTTEDATHDLIQALTETLSPLELQNERVARLGDASWSLGKIMEFVKKKNRRKIKSGGWVIGLVVVFS